MIALVWVIFVTVIEFAKNAYYNSSKERPEVDEHVPNNRKRKRKIQTGR